MLHWRGPDLDGKVLEALREKSRAINSHGTPKWMVSNEKSYENGLFGGYPNSGNHHTRNLLNIVFQWSAVVSTHFMLFVFFVVFSWRSWAHWKCTKKILVPRKWGNNNSIITQKGETYLSIQGEMSEATLGNYGFLIAKCWTWVLRSTGFQRIRSIAGLPTCNSDV